VFQNYGSASFGSAALPWSHWLLPSASLAAWEALAKRRGASIELSGGHLRNSITRDFAVMWRSLEPDEVPVEPNASFTF
jgi:hypothetical protein